jgi:hypothetical protein
MAKSDNDSLDFYGFNDNIKYNRTVDYRVKKPFISTRNFIIILIISIILISYLSMTFIAGYYSWNEFPSDSSLIKVIKTYIAVLFAPFYLFYIFLKLSLFRTG